MKKLICLTLVAIMLASMLAACGTAEFKAEDYRGTFKAGYAIEDITPTEFPISSKGTTPYDRVHGVFSPDDEKVCTNHQGDGIYATCIAVNDGDSTVLLYTVDVGSIPVYQTESFKNNISAATGVPYDNIVLSATHTHSTPVPGIPNNVPANMRWLMQVNDGLVNAGLKAIEDLTDVEVYCGTTEVKNMAYVRRYFYTDGTPGGIWRQPESKTGKTPSHAESEADNSIQVIRFEREGKNDIVMANLQTHFTDAGGYLDREIDTKTISGDLGYYLRMHIEKKADAAGDPIDFAVFVGASGNISPNQYLGDKKRAYTSYATETTPNNNMATVVADAILAVDLNPIDPGKIQTDARDVTLNVRKDSQDRVDAAYRVKEAVNALYTDGKNAAGKAYYDGNDDVYEECAKEGFESMKEVNFTISRYEGYFNKGELESATTSLHLGAVSFGGLAFIAAPYEMFDTNGMQIKESSPFEMTFVIANAGGAGAYIPSALAVPNGGYEVYSSAYEYGAAEKLVAEFVEMLEAQKGIS